MKNGILKSFLFAIITVLSLPFAFSVKALCMETTEIHKSCGEISAVLVVNGDHGVDRSASVSKNDQIIEDKNASITAFRNIGINFEYTSDESDQSDDQFHHGLRPEISFVMKEIKDNKYDKNTVEYIVIHDTGNSRKGANALSHYYYFASGIRDASAHFFVDEAQVVQIIDESDGSWHTGVKNATYATPISNQNSLGIEMCINEDGDLEQTILNTIDLSAYLLYKYDLPLDKLVRHYDANGKNCPACFSADHWSKWYAFVDAVKAKLATYYGHNAGAGASGGVTILGSAELSADQLASFLFGNHPEYTYENALNLAETYISVGEIYGVRGDVAFCQAMWETGYLCYGNDTAIADNNFCGLKNKDGSDYASFATMAEGVEAHIQHLYCYASQDVLPEGRSLLDQRFFDSLRGTAIYWTELSGKWAQPGYDATRYNSLEEAMAEGQSYGQQILRLHGEAEKADGSLYVGMAAGAKPLLEIGSSGADVSELQKYLKVIGYDLPETTGTFDDATLKAVLDMQTKCELVVDGIVGEKTWTAVINSYVDTLKNGSKTGESVDAAKPTTDGAPVPADLVGHSDSPPEGQSTEEKTLSEKTGISVEGRDMVFIGCSGEDVRILQTLLQELGFVLDIDGVFGSETQKNVVSFQHDHGLITDGIAGVLTWTALGTATGSLPGAGGESASEKTDSAAILYFGCAGQEVQRLQTLLNEHGASLEVDGAFGTETYRALFLFQAEKGLEADGICGPLTWNALLN